MTTVKEEEIRHLANKYNCAYRFVKFILSVDDEKHMLEDKIQFLKYAVRLAQLSGLFISELKAESLSIVHKIPIGVVNIVLLTEEHYSSVLSRETRLAFLGKVMKKLMLIVDNNLP